MVLFIKNKEVKEMAASEGVDLEWAIVDLINIQNGEQKTMSRTYSPKIISQAENCVKHVVKFAGNNSIEAWHSDNKNNPFRSFDLSKT